MLLLIHPSKLFRKRLASDSSHHKLVVGYSADIGPFVSGPRPFVEEESVKNEGSPEHVDRKEDAEETTDPSDVATEFQRESVKVGIFYLQTRK